MRTSVTKMLATTAASEESALAAGLAAGAIAACYVEVAELEAKEVAEMEGAMAEMDMAAASAAVATPEAALAACLAAVAKAVGLMEVAVRRGD